MEAPILPQAKLIYAEFCVETGTPQSVVLFSVKNVTLKTGWTAYRLEGGTPTNLSVCLPDCLSHFPHFHNLFCLAVCIKLKEA